MIHKVLKSPNPIYPGAIAHIKAELGASDCLVLTPPRRRHVWKFGIDSLLSLQIR